MFNKKLKEQFIALMYLDNLDIDLEVLNKFKKVWVDNKDFKIDGMNILQKALFDLSPKISKFLLETDYYDIDALTDEHETALSIIVAEFNVTATKLAKGVLKKKPNVDVQNMLKETPLMVAIESGIEGSITLEIAERTTKPNFQNQKRETALDYCLLNERRWRENAWISITLIEKDDIWISDEQIDKIIGFIENSLKTSAIWQVVQQNKELLKRFIDRATVLKKYQFNPEMNKVFLF